MGLYSKRNIGCTLISLHAWEEPETDLPVCYTAGDHSGGYCEIQIELYDTLI